MPGQSNPNFPREVTIINLDPANEPKDYPIAISLPNLLSLDEAMNETELGPNGGMLYCMEYLEENIDWLIDQLYEINPTYVLIDCPGQTELFATHEVLPTIFHRLQKMNYNLTTVHLIDSMHIGNSSIYLSALLQGLACNMNFELPFITLLSKADLLKNYGFDVNLEDFLTGNSSIHFNYCINNQVIFVSVFPFSWLIILRKGFVISKVGF